jgi:hypothetical protein
MQPIDPATIQAQLPQRRGMFAGLGSALRNVNPGDVVSAFLAGMYPQYAQAYEGPMLQRQRIQGEMQAQANLQNLEFQRQLALAQQSAMLKLQYPSDDFSLTLYQAGYRPGTPEWTAMMKQRAQAQADPAVQTGNGPMPYSAFIAQQHQPPQVLSQLPPGAVPIPDQGGPTQPASGGF